MRKCVESTLLALLFLASTIKAGGFSTIVASSCSVADVGTAITSSNDGDTVTIPSGSCTWTSGVSYSKAIELVGVGAGITIITDEIPRSSGVIASPGIAISTTSGKSYRVSGFTIQGSSAVGYDQNNKGFIQLSGSSTGVRIDHIDFNTLRVKGVKVGDSVGASTIYGVFDHNTIEFIADGAGAVKFMELFNGGANYGDQSWNAATQLGTANFWFVEDNSYTGSDYGAVFDCWAGCRFVFRHNTVTGPMFLETHGTEFRARALRAFEIYNNTFTHPSEGFVGVDINGGTGVIHDNTYVRWDNPVNYRTRRTETTTATWGNACDGTGAWDQNTMGGNGYACLDQVGRASGDLISGGTPSPTAWPTQALEPVYRWSDGAIASRVQPGSETIQSGRDFFDSTTLSGYTPYTYPYPYSSPSPSTSGGRIHLRP